MYVQYISRPFVSEQNTRRMNGIRAAFVSGIQTFVRNKKSNDRKTKCKESTYIMSNHKPPSTTIGGKQVNKRAFAWPFSKQLQQFMFNVTAVGWLSSVRPILLLGSVYPTYLPVSPNVVKSDRTWAKLSIGSRLLALLFLTTLKQKVFLSAREMPFAAVFCWGLRQRRTTKNAPFRRIFLAF